MRRYLFVAALIAALFVTGYVIVRVVASNSDRTDDLCDYAYHEKVFQRVDAIENYRRIPPAGRERLVLAGIVLHPRQELIDNLHGRYGNQRLPSYCPQHDDPVRIPKDLRESGR